MTTRGPVLFEVVDHTGDLGVVVRGRTLPELFERAAAAMFAQLADLARVEPREEDTIRAEAPDREALLVAWLSELLVRHSLDGKVYSCFEVTTLGDRRLEGRVWGEPTEPDRHGAHTELKAVTYHCLRIDRPGKEWRARVIFDV
jgi:SHS2 domain-containing protein